MSDLAQANFDAQPYWDATAKGEFVVARCTTCGEAHHYPRAVCPFCRAETVTFEPASGKGEIYSLAITRMPDKPLRVVAYVTLAEGPTMMTKIIDAPDDVAIGDPVRVDFQTHPEGLTVPVFRLDRN
ncbi:Zn-ribbon domain-containing OB-fold protein [Maritimibacter alkaliphilus]|uniref:Zn-ribbon domain-containing OB-fold protein n=1 Tax=Maritimibacter alkaliphilus TaxID=404236 RepID=UPI00192C6DD7|nr:OB-fold domain-containing protein [Maritimibacter alkaliphilus]